MPGFSVSVQAFKGIWRLQPGLWGPASTYLIYSLYVQPHPWLPVGLIQGRISRDVQTNLQAVQVHAEACYQLQVRHANTKTSVSSHAIDSFSSAGSGSDGVNDIDENELRAM